MFGYFYTEIITRCFNAIRGYKYWIQIPQYYNNKIIFKGTIKNLQLAIIISFRHFLDMDYFRKKEHRGNDTIFSSIW